MKVKQIGSTEAFRVNFELIELLESSDERLYHNARRRTKTRQAAKEVAGFKLLLRMRDRVKQQDVYQWVAGSDGKAFMAQKEGHLLDWVVVCEDRDTAMRFKLTFC